MNQSFEPLFTAAEQQNPELPPGLLGQVALQESNYNPYAVGPNTKYGNAKGLFQFIDSTAKQYGVTDPFDPVQSTQGAAKYLAALGRKYNGDWIKALAAYNWGPGNVDKHGLDKAPPETQKYIYNIASKTPSLNLISSAQADEAPQPKAASGFDFEGAKKEGYSDSEIADYLSQQRNFDAAGARKEGYSDQEIIDHLSGSTSVPAQSGVTIPAGKHAYQVPGTIEYDQAQKQNAVNSKIDVNPATGQDTLFASGAGKAVTDLALAALQRGGAPGEAASLREAAKQKQALDAPLTATKEGQYGEIAGQVGALAPLSLIPGANTVAGGMVIGGVGGALQPTTDENQALYNTMTGAALGGAGSAAGRVLGSVVRPTAGLPPNAARVAAPVLARGGRLLPGEATDNRFFRGLEASLEAFPPTSGSISRVKAGNQQVINRMVSNAIGEDAPALTQDVIQSADQRIGNVFDSVATDTPIRVNPQTMNTGLAQIARDTQGVVPIARNPLYQEAAAVVQSGQATGQQLQHLSSRLRTAASQQMQSQTGDRELGRALFRVRELVDDQLQAGLTPRQAQAFGDAREQYRNLMLLTTNRNVLNEATGDVSARNLSGALRTKDRSSYLYGRRAPPVSTQNLHDVARFGKHFNSLIGDSGTATRQFLPWLLSTGGAGAAGGALAGGHEGAIGGAAAGLGIPLTAALLSRGYASPAVTNYLMHGIPLLQSDIPAVANLLRYAGTALPGAAVQGQ